MLTKFHPREYCWEKAARAVGPLVPGTLMTAGSQAMTAGSQVMTAGPQVMTAGSLLMTAGWHQVRMALKKRP